MKLGIVSTIRRWDQQTVLWIRYHLAIGFEYLYLFVDEAALPPVRPPNGVRVTLCDAEWWQAFAWHPLYRELDPARLRHTAAWWSPQSLTFRQLLNAECGITWALSDGVSWLLHIDGDELFQVDSGDVVEHFESLGRQRIGQARYLNHEAVTRDQADCPFTTLILFRRNYDALNSEERNQVDVRFARKPWFLSYVNGKSAVKLARGVRPCGVHSFSSAADQQNRTLASAAILHYPYTNYERFCEKHRSLGLFDTHWLLGGKWNPPSLLVEAQECLRRRDENALRKLYRDWVLIDAEDQRALLEAGALLELPQAAELLRNAGRTNL